MPFELRLTPPQRLMLLTLADDETYGDLEVQWVRDASGAAGLVLLAVRRGDGRADVVVQDGVSVERADYDVGAGIASFGPGGFAPGRFEVSDRGVQLDVGVTLPDGRVLRLEVHEARVAPRPLVRMLAPAGHSMRDPRFFPFFWMDDIWFLRWRGAHVQATVDGEARRVTRVGTPWRLARYTVHAVTALWCPQHDGRLPSVPDDPGEHPVGEAVVRVVAGPAVAEVAVERDGQRVAATFDPPVPTLLEPGDGPTEGQCALWASGRPQLQGTWTVARDDAHVHLSLRIDQPWRPGPQPAVAAAVFRALAVFRTWPTTYRWDADVSLGAPSPTMTSRWTRV